MKVMIILLVILTNSILICQSNVQQILYSVKSPKFSTLALEGDTLWIGSDLGIIKYNTVTSSKTFYTNEEIKNGYVRAMVIDREKNIWLAVSSKGIAKFDGKSWTLFNNANTGQSIEFIDVLQADSLGNIWAGGLNTGLIKYDGKSWTCYNKSNSPLYSNNIQSMIFDNKGSAWIATNVSLQKLDGNTWTSETSHPDWFTNNQISSMAVDHHGRLWLGLIWGGLYYFNGDNWIQCSVSYGNASGMLKSINVDLQDNIWISTSDGLVSYDGQNSKVVEWNRCIFGIIFDQKGNGWIAFEGESLFKLTNNRMFEINLTPELPYDGINDIVFDKTGNAWIGTGGDVSWIGEGLAKFDGKNWTVYDTSNTHSGLPDNNIKALAIGKQDELWIGTFSNGLTTFDGKTWKTYNTKNSGLPSNKITCLAIDREDNLWIGTYGGGLAMLHGSIWKTYYPCNRINSIVVDSAGIVWVATDGGLYKYNGNDWANYSTLNSSIPGNNIVYLELDPQGNLWMIVCPHGPDYFSGNLYKFDGKDFTKYAVPDIGCPDYMVTVAFEQNGTMWAGHDWAGCFKFDGNKWILSGISGQSGINKIVIDKYGNKWLCLTYNGLIEFNENGIVTDVIAQKGPGPITYSLSQNYPNPFNPATKINYSVEHEGFVTIKVYDLLGKEISTLVNEYKPKGNYSANFNAGNLPSGIYFYMIKSGNFSEVKKMMILK